MKAPSFIDIHTHKSNLRMPDILEVVNLFPQQLSEITSKKDAWFSVGLHPWFINPDNLEGDFSNLQKAIEINQVLAIGETGLDILCSTPMDIQKMVFHRHLRLADLTRKPVIVHSVKAYPDIVEAYKMANSDVKLIFHGFAGNLEIAGQLLKRGFYLSFGEALFNNRGKSARVFKNVPFQNIFLETDESERSIEEVYEKAAGIKGVSIDELKLIVANNFNNCFRKTI